MIKWSSSSWCKILGHFTKQIEWLIEGIANCTSTIFCRTKITIFPRIWTKIDSKNKFFQRNKVNLYSFASNDMKIFEKIELQTFELRHQKKAARWTSNISAKTFFIHSKWNFHLFLLSAGRLINTMNYTRCEELILIIHYVRNNQIGNGTRKKRWILFENIL